MYTELRKMVAQHMAEHHGWTNTPEWTYEFVEMTTGDYRVTQNGYTTLGYIRDGVFTVTSEKALACRPKVA